jgi:hypothetical protein
MSSSNQDTNQDAGGSQQPASGPEEDHPGSSGEGAASALAHLKTQTRQHRRQSGDGDDPAGGHAQ